MLHAEPVVAAPTSPFEGLPFNFDQRISRTGAIVMLALLVPMLAMIVVPVGLLLILAADDVRNAVAGKPLGVGLLALGLVAWAALFLVPARQIVGRFWNERSVTVAADRVAVSEAGLFGSRLWIAPLAEFSGIAHHVRATLSGVRHELVLVHRDRRRNVLLHTADRVSQATIDRAAALFHLPQIPARELYRVTRSAVAPPLVDPF